MYTESCSVLQARFDEKEAQQHATAAQLQDSQQQLARLQQEVLGHGEEKDQLVQDMAALQVCVQIATFTRCSGFRSCSFGTVASCAVSLPGQCHCVLTFFWARVTLCQPSSGPVSPCANLSSGPVSPCASLCSGPMQSVCPPSGIAKAPLLAAACCCPKYTALCCLPQVHMCCTCYCDCDLLIC